MIDIRSEQVLPLSRAIQLFPTKPHIATLWRWVNRGVRGHRLECVRVGGTICTSEQAVHRFLSRLNGVDVHAPVPEARLAEVELAEASLAARGMLRPEPMA